MSNKLVIRDEVVQSCIRDGRASHQQLEASSGFADGLADAAGTNGPLAQTLRDADQAWTLRRTKLLEMLRSLVDSIEAVNQAFQDADAALKDQIQPDGPTPVPTPTPTSVPTPTPSPGPDSTPQPLPQPTPQPDSTSGPSFPAPAAGGGASTTAPVAALPDEVTSPPVFPVVPGGSMPPAATPLPQEFEVLIRDFAARWSTLTGQSVDDIVALIVTGLGAGGVITIAAIATIIAALQPGGSGNPGSSPVDGGPGSGGASTSPTGSGGSSSGSPTEQSAPGESDEPTSGGDEPADEAAPELVGRVYVPLEGLARPVEVSVDAPEAPANGGGAPIAGEDAVSPADLEALTPESGGSSAPAPADLAPLPPLGEGGGSGGGSAGAGGAGAPVELPPLEPEFTLSGGSAPLPGAPDALPDLTTPANDGVSAQLSGVGTLPDLGVASADDHGRMAAAPMMGGMGAMAGAASGANAASGATAAASSSASSVGGERSGARQAARDVLKSQEGDEGR